jgi:hypothetical protein
MARRAAQAVRVTAVERPLTDEALGPIVEAALRRAALVGDLKAAVLAGDAARVMMLARRVCGLEEESER